MYTSSVEFAFSITPYVKGKFSWKGTKMRFNPTGELVKNTTYIVSISTAAKSIEKIPLENPFSWNFTTIAEGTSMKPDDWDDDDDGFKDTWEIYLGTDPLDSTSKPVDTDSDGEPDGDAANTKEWMDLDDDNDGLTDDDENIIGTDPLLADTDSDGYIDSIYFYPLDSTKWEKKANPQGSDDGLLTGIIIAVIIAAIIMILMLFIFFKKRNEGQGPQRTTGVQPDAGRQFSGRPLPPPSPPGHKIHGSQPAPLPPLPPPPPPVPPPSSIQVNTQNVTGVSSHTVEWTGGIEASNEKVDWGKKY
jgi:hypothetical protein